MKLLLQLYEAAAAGPPSMPLEERCAAAGAVPKDLVEAFKAVLTDDKLDGAFKVRSERGARGVLVCMQERVLGIKDLDATVSTGTLLGTPSLM